jgi:hypothetical protein
MNTNTYTHMLNTFLSYVLAPVPLVLTWAIIGILITTYYIKKMTGRPLAAVIPHSAVIFLSSFIPICTLFYYFWDILIYIFLPILLFPVSIVLVPLSTLVQTTVARLFYRESFAKKENYLIASNFWFYVLFFLFDSIIVSYFFLTVKGL